MGSPRSLNFSPCSQAAPGPAGAIRDAVLVTQVEDSVIPPPLISAESDRSRNAEKDLDLSHEKFPTVTHTE